MSSGQEVKKTDARIPALSLFLTVMNTLHFLIFLIPIWGKDKDLFTGQQSITEETQSCLDSTQWVNTSLTSAWKCPKTERNLPQKNSVISQGPPQATDPSSLSV